MSSAAIAIGWAGQALFAARTLYQWLVSERLRRAALPRGYWWLSLVGSMFVLVYASLARNAVFFLGAVPGAVTAARNLRIVRPARRVVLLPWALLLGTVVVWSALIPLRQATPFWTTLGALGALLWGGRHVVQWWISERRGTSLLPAAFFTLSLGGSALLLAYAAAVRDPVMVAGYAFGAVPYLRNLVLLHRYGVAS